MSDVDPLPLLALAVLAGANPETQADRKIIREFIEEVNPRFEFADEAANQLVYVESVTQVPAKLMAALVAQERRWRLERNGIYLAPNLTQVIHSTARRCFGHNEAPDWQTNLLWGAWYLRWCMEARVRAKYGKHTKLEPKHWRERELVWDALREYNGGPEFAEKPVTNTYARAVFYYRNRMR